MCSCPHPLPLRLLALMLLLALPCPSALAKGSGEGLVASAERAKGMVSLNLGQYDEAIEHLSQAYALTQDPVLLYSLGQAYHLAGKPEKALASYSSFLRAAGSTPKYRTQLERATAEIETIASFVLNRPADRGTQEKKTDTLTTAPDPAGRDLEPPPVQNPGTDQATKPAVAAVEPPPLSLTPRPPSPPPAGLSLSSQASMPAQPPASRFYNRWWFWTSVGGALALGSAAIWWFSRPESHVPPSSYGVIRVSP